MNRYSIALEDYLINHKKVNINIKIEFFKKLGEIFRGLLIAVTKVHSVTDNNQIFYYVQSIKSYDIGIYTKSKILWNDINSRSIVIRKTDNITRKLNIGAISIKNFILKLESNRQYTENESRNINYVQVFDYFLDIIYKYASDYKFLLHNCFGESEIDRLLLTTDCPAFMLMAFRILPPEERLEILKLIKHNKLNANPELVRFGLFHIFDLIAQYNDNIEEYNYLTKVINLEEYSKDTVPEFDSYYDNDTSSSTQ